MIVYALRRKRDGQFWNRWSWKYEKDITLGCLEAQAGGVKRAPEGEVVVIQIDLRVIGLVEEAPDDET